ncbi:MAG: hypothetical protein HQ541_10575 [Mariniphaga sp.]|nr:hypothetical protein [Mariniphaga sp.]
MISNQTHNQSIAVTEFSLTENHTVQRILVFIKNSLPEFESSFRESNFPIHKEDDISKKLTWFFNDKARSQKLYFQFNEKKGVDFTIYVNPFKLGAPSIFMIEAKRLSKSHYDYVSGETGGIERIRREHEDFGKHLNQGAMIGYIQDENHEYWLNRINKWIEELMNKKTDIVWQEEDKLIAENKLSEFKSIHSRKSKEPITLYHYWIALN